MAEVVDVLFIEPEPDYDTSSAREKISLSLPNAHVKIFSLGRNEIFWQLHRKLRSITHVDMIILPFRERFLLERSYWLALILLLTGKGVRRFLNIDGNLCTPLEALLPILFPLQPLISILLILNLPIYYFKQILGRFMFSREENNDELLGFGSGKGASGLIYWLTLTRKARRFGLLGLANDTYWGMPLGVHNWPLAVWFLKKLGYRKYIYLSVLLLGTGLTILAIHNDCFWCLGLLPFLVGSPYYIFNIYVGTWETLAWGWGVIALVTFISSWPLAAGVFFAATLLTHPGVSALTMLTLASIAFVGQYPFTDLMVLGAIALGLTAWFLIAYWRARFYLGRDISVNTVWGSNLRWSLSSAYQFIIYTAFCLVAFLWGKSPFAETLVLILPLLILFLNTKIRWIFSQYTVLNYMLVVGAIYTFRFPAFLPALLFSLVIFTSPRMIWNRAKDFWGFDLSPIKLGVFRDEIINAFANLKEGRVAFEHTGFGTVEAYLVAALGYILADQPIQLFNTSYAEIGDLQLYRKYTQHLNAQSNDAVFEEACKSAGVKYIVAFTTEFGQNLQHRGYRTVHVVENIKLLPWSNQATSSFTIFELPWNAELITPNCNLQILPNHIEFLGKGEQSYVLKYLAFRGWRAFQNGKSLALSDAKPGIFIHCPEDGVVTLKYRYYHYWF